MDGLVILQLMLRSKRSLGRGSRIKPRTFGHGCFFGLGGQVGLMLALFSALGPLLGASWTHVAFFFAIFGNFWRFRTNFRWFGADLGRVWGGILP